MATRVRRIRHLVYVVLALLIPVLVGGLNAARSQAIGGSAFSSERDADGDTAPSDNQDPAGLPELTLLAARAPVVLPAGQCSVRMPVCPARVAHPTQMRTSAQLSASAPPLRC